jgi:hypothetical protein
MLLFVGWGMSASAQVDLASLPGIAITTSPLKWINGVSHLSVQVQPNDSLGISVELEALLTDSENRPSFTFRTGADYYPAPDSDALGNGFTSGQIALHWYEGQGLRNLTALLIMGIAFGADAGGGSDSLEDFWRFVPRLAFGDTFADEEPGARGLLPIIDPLLGVSPARP